MVVAVAIATATGCLGEPSGPFGNQLVLSPQSLAFEALGDSAQVSAVETGPGGAPLTTATVEYSSAAPSVVTVDSSGLVISRGNGVTWIIARTPSGASDSIPVSVIQLPRAVVASTDTVRLHALGAQQPLGAVIVDRLGAPIWGLTLQYGVHDTTIAAISADGRVAARRNGVTFAQVRGAGESLAVVIHVEQRPVQAMAASDTLRFVALGETATAAGIAMDSLGHPVLDAAVGHLSVDDSAVLDIVDSVTVRARQNGHTVIRFSVGGLPVDQHVVVAQVPDTIVASVTDTLPILSLQLDSLVPLRCEVRDRNGYPIPIEPSVDVTEFLSGTTCGSLRARQSALATLVLRAGSVTATVPVAIALRPTVSSPLGDFLLVDSLPATVLPWAPTLWRDPSGMWQLYFTGYQPDNTSLSGYRGHLHRLVSSDGVQFQYDGIVLQRDSVDCAPNGSGIENIAIVPRSDAPGWRMFYSSGSFTCDGWQVFSAVSADAQVWTKEPGIRLDNGDPGAPWPVGEGMVIDRLPSAEWRMLVGGYRRTLPVEDKFHIVEWRSTDQVQWTYRGTVLTTDQLPSTGQRSVYSPTIREVARGLWRMLFTADDLNVPGGRSRIWSAISLDRQQWQLEGEIMGVNGTNLFYASLVDERLIFIRKDGAQNQQLATATVAMP